MSPSAPIHTQPASPTPGSGMNDAGPSPDTLDEAADQFGKMLIRQLVSQLTDDLFSGMAGKHQSGSLRNQARLQSDTLTDVLSDKLEESLHIGDRLREQWTEKTDTRTGPLASGTDLHR